MKSKTFCMKLGLIFPFLSTNFRAMACPNKSPCNAFCVHFHGTFHICLSHPLWITLNIPYFPSNPHFLYVCVGLKPWDTLATYSNSIRLVPPVPPGKEVLQRLLWKSKFNASLCLCCKELHPQYSIALCQEPHSDIMSEQEIATGVECIGLHMLALAQTALPCLLSPRPSCVEQRRSKGSFYLS